MKLILVGINAFSERWVKVFFASKKVKVAALVNHREDRFTKVCREYSYPIDRCYTSLKKALARRDAQGVIITIPTKYHYRYTREALLAGANMCW